MRFACRQMWYHCYEGDGENQALDGCHSLEQTQEGFRGRATCV